MDFATSVLGSLLPKLASLVEGEYKLQKNVKKDIKFLKEELELMHTALCNVGGVPPEQLNEQVRIWARDVREMSYDMDDIIDTFLVRVQGSNPPSEKSNQKFIQKMQIKLAICKRHQVGEQIKDIKERVVELAARHDRYKDHSCIKATDHVTQVDPRLKALYVETTQLIGISEKREEIIIKLEMGDDSMSIQKQKIVSIVGFGGLGKTTLANAVYDKLKKQFDCTAFVMVSRNPDLTKVLKDMLYELDKGRYKNIHSKSHEAKQLIDLARKLLKTKRYFIVFDDIWDISIWDIIKCALPDKNTGCKIITTTRNTEVAKSIGGAYEMKPLSPVSSGQLLYRRIFGNEDLEKCLSEELTEVSNRILKKCAGVPLAIITIASLLASKGRNKIEWDEVSNSIGDGMENNPDAKNMRMILSYSYYDLPSHLRTCLLYLSIFPEDFFIEKDRLIRLWIAEGFIQHEEQGKSLFELGESYINELVNRSLIQAKYDFHSNSETEGCHVHDMVLDLINSISSEENFVTIFSDSGMTSSPTTVRRLSLKRGKLDDGKNPGHTISMPAARSFLVFPWVVDQIVALQSFKFLRVLDLQSCDLPSGYSFQYLSDLSHLRYLNLRSTGIFDIPDQVGNLKFLETLDVRGNPFTVRRYLGVQPRLKHLTRLRTCLGTIVTKGIENLKLLEELSCLQIDDSGEEQAKALGLLTELRVLVIDLLTNIWNDKLAESLCKLQKIQDLVIEPSSSVDRCNIVGLDAWVAPPHLRKLDTRWWCWFSRLPAGMNNNPSHIFHFSIAVRDLRQEDLLILGRLLFLRHLELDVDHVNLGIDGRLVAGDGSFPCLLRCMMFGFVVPVLFEHGAMARLVSLHFDFDVGRTIEITSSDGGFDSILGNPPSLEQVFVKFWNGGARKEKEGAAQFMAVKALSKAAKIHPNQPNVGIIPLPGLGTAIFEKHDDFLQKKKKRTDDDEDSDGESFIDEDTDSDGESFIDEDTDSVGEHSDPYSLPQTEIVSRRTPSYITLNSNVYFQVDSNGESFIDEDIASVQCGTSIRYEHSGGRVGMWLGRAAMIGFASAMAVELHTGKGFLENFGVVTPAPTLALVMSGLVGGLVVFSLQSFTTPFITPRSAGFSETANM